MVKHFGDTLISWMTEEHAPAVTIEIQPHNVPEAIGTLAEYWPELVNRLYPDEDSQPGELTFWREPGVLTIADVAAPPKLLAYPQARIARRFERVGEYLQSLSDQLALRHIAQLDPFESGLIFQPDKIEDDMVEAIDRLRLRGVSSIEAGRQLRLQLDGSFRITTVAQLIIRLALVLNANFQIECDEHVRAFIRNFWGWATANHLYLVHELLTKQSVTLADRAFVLFYSKLLDRLEHPELNHMHDVDVLGRLRLPLVHNACPCIVPKRWVKKMNSRLESVKQLMGAELLSQLTDPPLFGID